MQLKFGPVRSILLIILEWNMFCHANPEYKDYLPIYYVEEICGQEIVLENVRSNSAAILEGLNKPMEMIFIDSTCTVKVKVDHDYQIRAVLDYVMLNGNDNYLEILPSGENGTRFSELTPSEKESVNVGVSVDNETIINSYIHKVSAVQWNQGGFRVIVTATQPVLPSGECPDPQNQFKCTNGWCIAKDLKCNGHNHCGDKSNEGLWSAGCVLNSPGAVAAIGIFCGFIVLVLLFIIRMKYLKSKTAMNYTVFQNRNSELDQCPL